MKQYQNYLMFLLVILYYSTVYAQETILQLPTNDTTSSFNVTNENGSRLFRVDGSGKITGNTGEFTNVKYNTLKEYGNETLIILPTNDNTSSFNIKNNDLSSIFKVDGDGRLSGDGSGLSNIGYNTISEAGNETRVILPTNDNTSNFNVSKQNGTSVFNIDGSGKMSGDGSGLSFVKPLINYIQGNQSVYFHEGMIPGLNLYEAQIMRSVTIDCPGPGIILALASGYCDWESPNQDLVRIWFHPHPTVSPSGWETPDFHNLRIVSDYNCTDSSDQYTSWSISKVYTVSSASNYTVNVCADKPFTNSKVLIGDVAMQLLFFPTGGTGSSSVSLATTEIPESLTPNLVAEGSVDGSQPVSREDLKGKSELGNNPYDLNLEMINKNLIELKNENEMLKKRLSEIESLIKERN